MVYLKVDVQTLLNRLQSQRHLRPLISHLEDEEKLDEFIRKHLFERQYYYMQSDLVIDASSANPDEIAEEILQSLKRSEEHTSELQSRGHLVCRLLLEKKKKT